MSLAITQIDVVIRKTASSAKESAAASEDLKSQAGQVRLLVGKLRGHIAGQRTEELTPVTGKLRR